MKDIIWMQQIERISDNADAVIQRINDEEIDYNTDDLRKEYLLSTGILKLFRKVGELEHEVKKLKERKVEDILNSRLEKRNKDSDECKCPACVFVRVLRDEQE